MPFFSILFLYILGFLILNVISSKFSISERLGLAFPIGLGVVSIYIFLISILSIPINRVSILIGLLVFISALVFWNYKKKHFLLLGKEIKNSRTELKGFISQLQLVWVVGLIAVIYVLYMITVKSLYWPTFHYDAIAGYDLLARAIAREGTINCSVFDLTNRYFSFRTLYPPLFPIAFAYAYIMGFEMPKIIVALYLISLAFIYYGFSRKLTNPISSILFLFFVLITPEFLAQSAMLMTNVPQAVYTLGSVGAFFIWYKHKEISYFFLASVMSCLGVWGRSEGILFAATLGFLLVSLFIQQRKEVSFLAKENIRKALIFGVPSIFIYIVWEIFLSIKGLDAYKQPFSLMPYYDAEKVERLLFLTKKVTFETRYYGYIINTFFIVCALSIVHQLYKRKLDSFTNLLALYIFGSVFLYLLLYYQIRVPLSSFTGYITNGYKRGLFNVIPLLGLYISNVKLSKGLFDKLIIK